MKGPLDRTKVVLRHLPPTISQSNLVDHIDSGFSGRYNWFEFRPGKSSPKRLIYSRAYIDFNKPEDVMEFAMFFNGHAFVNEKGTQFKVIVEYAPSQRVPKQWSKKDGREGTIHKDPEYLDFLEFLAKPIENLPSAEIQLERKEAEKAGTQKDIHVITPLMEYVRQKRAAKVGARRIGVNGKSVRRGSARPSRNVTSGSAKRGSERRTSGTMQYVLRDSSKNLRTNDQSPPLLVSKGDDQQLVYKSTSFAVSGNETLERESGRSGPNRYGKKKILLLKGKEKEISNVSGTSLPQQNAANLSKVSHGSALLKQTQHREAVGKKIRSILLKSDSSQSQPSLGSQSEAEVQTSSQYRDQRLPPAQSFQKEFNVVAEEKVVCNELSAGQPEKLERRTRHKNRPDCVVWAPHRRSDGSHASDESLLSSSQMSKVVDSTEGIDGEMKHEMQATHVGEYRPIGSGRGGSHFSADNGSYRLGGRRCSTYNIKDGDGYSAVEGKSARRGASGYSSQERQMWVQKSSSGT